MTEQPPVTRAIKAGFLTLFFYPQRFNPLVILPQSRNRHSDFVLLLIHPTHGLIFNAFGSFASESLEASPIQSFFVLVFVFILSIGAISWFMVRTVVDTGRF